MEDKLCYRHEVLVAGLTLFQKVDCLHWSVPDFLAPVDVFKALCAKLAAVQADEVESTPGIHVFLDVRQVTPHSRRNKNMKPRLTNLKSTVKVIQCLYLWRYKKNTNRARLPRLHVVAGFAAGFIGGACTGFLAGSIMFLQGNNVKVFVKIKVLKSQEVKCRCTYGVTLPREYLQVVGWWQRWSLRIRCSWSSLRPSTTTPTYINYRLHCCNFSVPTKETIQVYSHLGTHATPVVKSSKLKIVTVTYECSEPSSDVLPWITVYVTCLSAVSTSTTASSREPLENKHKNL